MSPDPNTKNKNARAKGHAIGQTCVSLFEPVSLRNEAAIDTAVCTLDHHLADPTADIDEAVRVIESVPHLLEFILCVASDNGHTLLSTAIMERRPNTAEEFSSSTAARLLIKFSLSLFLQYDRASDAPSVLADHRQSVELASSVLHAVKLLVAGDTLSEEPAEVSNSRWAAKSKDKANQKRKRSLHTGRAPAADVQPILNYGAAVPTSKLQAAELVAEVIEKQMTILQYFLNMFRQQDTIAFFKKVYLPPAHDHDGIPGSVLLAARSPSTHETRGAYPLVQPVKAALYFDSADGFGHWRIQMSGRADRDLRRARREDAKVFGIIVSRIKDLSNGRFTKDNHKKLVGGEVQVPIYEAKMTRDSRLVYHIHCGIDFQDNIERQMIRIFGVYTHSQIDGRFWDAASRQLNTKGPEYRKRCIYRKRKTNAEGEIVIVPGEFCARAEEESAPTPIASSTLTRKDMEELHSLLALEKFVTLSQAFLNSILADQDVAHVFDVSAREKEIIEHESSCFVTGRSGTGKTTTIVFKILGIERMWVGFRSSMTKPRQVFVTKSQVLAGKVEEYYAKLCASYATAHLSPAALSVMAAKRQSRRDILVDADEEIFWNTTLPRRYGALEDSHFPMFVTYDHLCRLLEGEFHHLIEQEKLDTNTSKLLQEILQLGNSNRAFAAQRHRVIGDDRRTFLDYDIFLEVYWSHFPEDVRRFLNPDLVFGEFMAVIKGSEDALNHDQGFLDRHSYCNDSSRRTQTTSSTQREQIYELFKVYTKRKRENSHYDVADRTRLLIKSLKVAGVPGKALDFIYVDEAQDNLLIDSFVLRMLCRNPHGLFFAGDTAQTISPGCSFKLTDLKSFMYRVEENMSSLAGKRARPETFHLTTNYRSHSGIVDCAHSVVELITKYWPDAIDRLPQEKGMTPGPKPVFFGGQSDAIELQQSLFRDSTSGGSIEFGARQCIIVRSKSAKQRLRAEVGDVGQILTVYESKGLEFDDVLLYNFFEDSDIDGSRWRVLLDVLPDQLAPTFDEGRHSGVCRELKSLYVAVTRARMNLWITDCSERAIPVRLLWSAKDLIKIHEAGTPIPKLAVSSGKEEWAEAARSLFVKRQYQEAMLGFERADRPHERQVSFAYLLRERARTTPAKPRANEPPQAAVFSEAAQAFMDSIPGATALERRSYYRIAAECYARGGDDQKAAAAYRHAEEYTLAAQHYRKAGGFDEAVEVIQSHAQDVDSVVAESILEVSKLHYIRENQMSSARALFEDDDQALEYMAGYDLSAPRATLLESLGKFYEAAVECHHAEGNLLEAIRVLLLDQNDQRSLSTAVDYILEGLWHRLSLGSSLENLHEPTVVTLLSHAEEMEYRLSDTNDRRNELTMFRAISEDDLPLLASLGDIFSEKKNVPAALLCFDRVFAHSFHLQYADPSEIALCFKTFLVYARILQRLSCDPHPCDNDSLKRLFAFTTASEELVSVPRGCRLYYTLCEQGVVQGMRETTRAFLVPRWTLEDLIKAELRERLKETVWDQNEMCHNLRRLQPCILFAVHGSCSRHECPQLHIGDQDNTHATYNTLVRIHLLQIMIFHTLYVTDIAHRDLARQQRAWLRRLYEALYPSHFKVGSVHILSQELVPELSHGRHILGVWLHDFLNRLHPERPPKAFLSNLMRATHLAMLFDRHDASRSLQRIPCAVRWYGNWQRPYALMRPGPQPRYIVHDLIATMQRKDATALQRGIEFLNHVLCNRLPVDIGVLCDFMDHLCASILVATYLRKQGNLHKLTLPRSWITQLFPDIDQLRGMQTTNLDSYTDFIGQLLEEIYTGVNADHLLFENFDLSIYSTVNFKIRILYFLRLCKNICLLGHNLPSNVTLRKNIGQVITALGRTINMSRFVAHYVYARDWNDLENAVLRSTTGSDLDGMIQLHHSSRSIPRRAAPTIREIVYSTTEQILSLLNVVHVDFFKLPGSSSDIALEHRVHRTGTSSSLIALPEQGIHQLRPADGVVATARLDNTPDEVQPADTGITTDSSDDEQEDEQDMEFTTQESSAAATIIAAYRKYMQNKAAEKSELQEMRRRVYAKFRACLRTMKPTNKTYRLRFLGSAPHLFVAVECLKNRLFEAKAIAGKRLFTVVHQELENTQAAMNLLSHYLKRSHELHKALAPTADVHKTGDMKKLKEIAAAVVLLVQQVEGYGHVPIDWREDIELGMVGLA